MTARDENPDHAGMTGWTDADLAALSSLRESRDRAEAAIRAQVAYLRQHGCAWETIAERLDVTKQAAHKRYRSTRTALADEPLPVDGPRL